MCGCVAGRRQGLRAAYLHQDNVCQPPGTSLPPEHQGALSMQALLVTGAEGPLVHLSAHSVSVFLAGGARRDRTTRTGEWPSPWGSHRELGRVGTALNSCFFQGLPGPTGAVGLPGPPGPSGLVVSEAPAGTRSPCPTGSPALHVPPTSDFFPAGSSRGTGFARTSGESWGSGLGSGARESEGRPLTELFRLRGRRGSRERRVVMVPPGKMETEEPPACRCVFRGARYGPAMGAVQPCARRERRAGRQGSGRRGTDFCPLFRHRGHQVCRALSDLKESRDPWGPLDR